MKARSTLGACISSGVSTKCMMRQLPGRRTSSCAGCWRDCESSSRDLIHFEPADDVTIDGDDIVARRKSGFRRRRPGQGLQNDDASRQQRNDAAEAFLRGGSMLLDLLELAGVEEDGMRIERAQQARDGALVKGLFGGDRVGRVVLDQRVGVDHAFYACVEIVRGAKRRREEEER